MWGEGKRSGGKDGLASVRVCTAQVAVEEKRGDQDFEMRQKMQAGSLFQKILQSSLEVTSRVSTRTGDVNRETD